MRILFITSNRLGDAVLSTGLLAHLVDRYPAARFTVACGALPAPLFGAAPRVERVIPVIKRPGNRHWLAVWRQCVTTPWSLVVDTRDTIVSRLVLARRRRGRKRLPPGRHKVEELAAVLRLEPPPAPALWLTDQSCGQAAELIPGDRPVLGLGPTANWVGKEWPADRFAELARLLTGEGGLLPGARIAVFGSPGERERSRDVLSRLDAMPVIDLVGRTDPLQAAACLQRCGLFVGNDSGLAHIAAAMGTPVVAVFGPGRPETYSPWGDRAAAVTADGRAPDAGTEEGMALMATIPVAAVAAAAGRLVSAAEARIA